MKTSLSILCAVAACALSLNASAPALSAAARDYASIPPALVKKIHAGVTREQFISSVMQELRQIDKNVDGLTAAEIEDTVMLSEAQARANALQRIYRQDLNNDGRVTRAEVEHVTQNNDYGNRILENPQYQKARERQVDELMKADTNGDGSIDFNEARSFKNKYEGNNYTADRARELLSLDPNKDGRLTAQELETMARNAFALVDIDGNSVISYDEHVPFNKVAQPIRAAEANTGSCEIPKPAPGQYMLVVGSYEGEAISTTSVVGQDEVTTVSQVEIEPGTEPLYLLLASSQPRIWQITGATSRVARVVLAARKGIGLTGIAREKVTFAPENNCLMLSSKADEITKAVVKGAITRSIGRGPDAIIGEYAIHIIKAPSGLLTKAPRRAPAPSGLTADQEMLWDESIRFNPAGVTEIDPAKVVASSRVERYQVLPQQSGLLQLMKEGVLQRISVRSFAGNMSFKIVKPMKRFPAGLAGAHSVTFLLAKGVPVPAGSPGHSCVISEDTGQPVADSVTCR